MGGSCLVEHFQIRIFHKTGKVCGLHVYHQIHLSGLQGHGTGRALRDHLPDHMLDGSYAAPVILKGLVFDALALLPFHQLIWAGSDGLFIEVVAALDQICRKDCVSMVAEVIKEAGLGPVCGDLDGIVIHDLYCTGGLAVLGNLWGFLTEIQGCLHVSGLHFLSIMEFHAFS